MAAAQTKSEPIWNPREVAAIVGGRWSPGLPDNATITGVTFKIEEIAAGRLFFTARPEIWGARFPATDHMLTKVRAAGAMGAVVEQDSMDADEAPLPVLIVENTRQALAALAAAARERFGGSIVAVTGTVGKTSVGRMIAHVLERQGLTVSLAGQRNSAAALQAALCSLDPAARFGIFELNMQGRRSIAPKSQLLRPDIAVVTTLGIAHLESHRGGMASVAETKAGIADGLRSGGICILPRDSSWYDMLAGGIAKHGASRRISFGEHPQADLRLTQADFAANGTLMDVEIQGRPLRVRLSAPGRHVALNCLAMLGTVDALQADVGKAAADIADWQPPAGRGRISALKLPGGDALLIDSSHNANPESMRAGIELLGLMRPGPKGRRIAVLADMLELGEMSARCHDELAAPLLQSNTDLLFAMGELMRRPRASLPENRLVPHFDDVDQLGTALETSVRPGDVLMIQGSRATKIGGVVERLKSIGRSSELVIDVDRRQVLSQIEADAPRIPASLVKLMTLHQVFAALDARQTSLHEKIRASARATQLQPQASVLGLAEGDFLSIEDVIRGLIVQSANDAAICIAEHLGATESGFVEQMNQAAQLLGLSHTTFANASGENNKGNRTTAREIATVALAIIDRFPHYLHYFAETAFVFKGRTFPPRNRLIRTYRGLFGMKTGHVPASGYHLVALAQRGNQRLLSVVMGAHSSDARDQRTVRLLDRGFAMMQPGAGEPEAARR